MPLKYLREKVISIKCIAGTPTVCDRNKFSLIPTLFIGLIEMFEKFENNDLLVFSPTGINAQIRV